jgi:hypothetical protein
MMHTININRVTAVLEISPEHTGNDINCVHVVTYLADGGVLYEGVMTKRQIVHLSGHAKFTTRVVIPDHIFQPCEYHPLSMAEQTLCDQTLLLDATHGVTLTVANADANGRSANADANGRSANADANGRSANMSSSVQTMKGTVYDSDSAETARHLC